MRLISLLLLAFVAGAAANQVEKVEPAELGIGIEHLSTVWEQNSGQTVFTYKATVDGADDLSHWVLQASGACLDLVDADEEWTNGLDHVTETSGFIHDFGLAAEDEERVYVIRFDGKVGTGDIMYSAVGGNRWAMDTIPGPDCAAANDYIDFGGVPANQSYSCDEEVPEGGDRAVDTIVEQPCPQSYTLRRTTSFGEDLVTESSFYITVTDDEAPQFAHLNRTVVVECGVDAEPEDPDVEGTTTDNCGEVTISDCVERTNKSCPADWVRVTTWTAIDECGNSNCFTLTVVHQDTLAPVITDVPEDLVLNCTDEIPHADKDTVTVTDVCSDCIGEVDFKEVTIDGECGNTHEIHRTWTVADCCGNTATASQVISVVDNIPPVLTKEDVRVTFECDEEVIVPEVTATDNCQDEDPVVDPPTNTTSGDSCTAVHMYTWTVSDDCWNVATIKHAVTVQDTQAPKFNRSTLPDDATASCDDIPPVADVKCYDNCHDVTIDFVNNTYESDCINEFVINRTWTCTDECGLSTSYTQLITVTDEQPPVFADGTIPANASYKCHDEVPASKPADEIDFEPELEGCDGTYNVTFEEKNSTDDKCDFTITRTWTATDCSNNSVSASQHIDVKDDVDPVLYPVPEDETVDCADVPPQATVGMYDSCDCDWDGVGPTPDCRTVNENEVEVPGSRECEGSYSLNRTWSTTDSCGNTAEISQIINVIDVTPPTFDEEPSDLARECDNVAERPTLTASDNCTDATVTEDPEFRVNGDCNNNYTLVWNYVASDDCDNTVNYTIVQEVRDTTEPTLVDVPADDTAECDDIPCPADVYATDNCDGLDLEFSETTEPTDDGCPQSYTIVRTWTATDECGHSVSDEQRIEVHDRTAPVWNGTIPSYSAKCDNVTFPDLPSVSDNCGEVTVTEHHFEDNRTCGGNYTIYRNFLASDECGNGAWLNYTVTVTDEEAPELVGVPDDESNECTLPDPVSISATDNCDAAPTVNPPSDVETARTCPFNYTVERTYSAIDECGNEASEVQTLTVYDVTAPDFTSDLPANATYECTAPEAEDLDAADNCGDTYTVPAVVTEISRECVHKYVEERTWTVTDSCGNSNSYTQLVEVKDDDAPVLSGVPDAATAECDDVPCPATVSASDNCDGVTLAYKEERINGSCPQTYTLVRTWNATDACGQSTVDSQTIEVFDRTAPEVPAASDISHQCDEFPTIVIPDPATIVDNCGAVNRTDYTTTVTGDCPQNYTVFHSYLYQDECGNGAWYNFSEEVYDTEAPSPISWTPAPPADRTYTTDERCTLPEPPVPSLTDNCDPEPTYSVANVSSDDAPACAYNQTVTHTYTYVDACDNEATESVTYTIEHVTPPQFISALPANTTAECPHDDDAHATLRCRDSCDAEFDATYDQERLNGSCEGEYTLLRTWTCTDACGLETAHTQEIFVNDTTPPSFDQSPGNQFIDYDLTCEEAPFQNVTATDACVGPTDVTPSRTELTRECDYIYTELHSFATADDCGNDNSLAYTVSYEWECHPTLSGVPADTEIQCSDRPENATVTAVDCCGVTLPVNETVTIHEEGAQDCSNSFVIERCWTAIDDCGKETTECQNISVIDTTPPVIDRSTIPGEQTVECGFVPGYPNVTVTDNCAGVELWLSVSEMIMDDCCWRKINRTWTARDECGNEAVPAQQRINVEDNIPPVLIGVPADAVETCPYELDDPVVEAGEPPLALGWCPSAGVAADSCGIEAGDAASLDNVKLFDGTVGGLDFVAGSYAIRWNDVVGRAFVAGNVQDSRNGDLYELNLEFDGLDRTLSGVLELNDTCYGEGLNASTWHFYTVAAGNLTGIAGTSTEGYEKCDFSAVAGEELQLGVGANGRNVKMGLRASLAVAGTSDSVTLRATLTPDGQDGCDVGDHLFPRKEILHGSIDDAEHPELECNETIPVNLTVTEEPGSCGGEITYTRCWYAEDFHGNSVRECQTVEVKDTTDPTLTGVPGPIEIQCDEELPCPADVTANDECSAVELKYVQSDPVDTNTSCPFNYKIHRTWTATDACNNSHSETQTITVNDHKKPTLHGVPAENGNFVCNETAVIPTVTANDTCDPDPELVVGGPTRVNLSDCPHHFRVEYTYTATDSCGNTRTDDWSYTVTDPFKPVIDDVADLTLECDDEIPAANPTCQDSCDGTITMAAPVESWTNTSECEFVYTRTWSCVDACGNAADDVTQTIRFVDSDAPTCEEPVDQSLDCTEPVPAQGSLTCDDNCDSSLDEFKNDFVVNQTCPHNYTQVYQWTYTDCAGHESTYEQRIEVTDSSAPTLSGVPTDDESYGCRADVPCPPTVNAVDDCGKPTLKYKQEWTESGICNDKASVTRTWTAEDECGHSTTDSYTITVSDDVAPTCTPLVDETVACDEFVSRSGVQPSCSDDCNTVSYRLFESETPGCEADCDFQVHYNWRVTDECGNVAWVNYTVTVEDRYSPEFVGVPADETQECVLTAPTAPTATHPCKDVTVSESSEESDRTCPHNFTTTYTWTTTGCCGETVTNQTVIRVEDSNAPVVDEPPADENVSCRAIPSPVSLRCTDECDGDFAAVFSEVDPAVGENECVERTITRTWTCTDACGLTSSKQQLIHVEANEPPTLHDVPANDTQECDEVDLSHSVTATDDCAGASLEVTVTVTNLTDDGDDCVDSYVIRQHFYAEDHCANPVEDERYITVEDTTPPTFDVCSCDDSDCAYCSYETECDAEPQEPALPNATDNCDTDVEVTRHHFAVDGECTHSYTQHYNWLATDNCGNQAWLNITVFVNDTQKPEFEEFPADEEQDCWDLDELDVPTASDNCANSVLGEPNEPYFFVNTTSNKTDGECENYQIVNKWTIVDECGNSATQTQTVTVVDQDPPTFDQNLTEIVDFTVECDEDPVPPVLTASDRCGSADVEFVAEPLADDGDGCASTRGEVWSWTATDLCGNQVQHNITVTWEDTTDPVLVDVPANTTAECDDIPCPDAVSATDNCDGVRLQYKETTEDGDCEGESTIYRTWTATDCVGNTVSQTQEIKVFDRTAPTFVAPGVPADETLECTENVTQPDVECDDACSSCEVVETSYNESEPGACEANYDVIQTWTATDDCGNAHSGNRTVRVRDTVPPTIKPSEPVCLTSLFFGPPLTVSAATVPGTLFDACDDCSNFTISLAGCHSNQDEALGVAPVDGAFNSDCFYDADTDVLTIVPNLSPAFPEGRVYVIAGTVTDDCGNEANTTTQIYVPWENPGSQEFLDNLEGEFALPANFSVRDDCVQTEGGCDDACPCEMSDTFCVEGDEYDSILLTPLASNEGGMNYNSTTDETTWSYRLDFSAEGGAPNRVLLGLDVSRLEVVSVSPDDVAVDFGSSFDTFASGVLFDTSDLADGGATQVDLAVTVRGRADESSFANVPVVVGGGDASDGALTFVPVENSCSGVRQVTGPDYSTIEYRSGNDVSGTVYVAGSVSGLDNDARIPLGGAVVDLVVLDSPTRQVLRSTMTAHDGTYAFHDVGDITEVGVALAADGYLRPNPAVITGSPGELLTALMVDPVAQEWPFGTPQPVSAGAGNDVTTLRIDDVSRPRYVRVQEAELARSFLGDSGSSDFWCYQLAEMGLTETRDRIASLRTAAEAAVPCVSAASVCSSADTLENAVRREAFAAALNLADGRGISQPFDSLNDIFLAYGKHVACDAAAPTSEAQEAALDLLSRLNGAGSVRV